MPAQSKSQQRLMGVAYAVKSGDMQLSDVDASYKDKVKELVDSMSLKDLKDFAETDHSGLPEEVTEGVIKVDIDRIMTKIMGALGYKQNPKMRQEVLAAFREDLKEIMAKHDYIVEAEDHEVGMAMGQLDAIHNAASELEDKIFKDGGERNIPAWIQSHITSAYEYLKQANDNFHELDESSLSAVAPNMVGGMGDVVLPNGDTPGSGDVPAGKGKAKKKKKILNLDEFIQEQEQMQPFKPKQGKDEELGKGEYEVGPTVDVEDEFVQVNRTRKLVANVVTFDSFNKR